VKILHVQETLSPNYGGPARVLPGLAAAQEQLGLDVEILTTNADTPRGRYRPPGRVCLEGTSLPVTYCSARPDILRFSAGVARFLHANARKFDLIHVHGLYRFPPSYAARYARKAGIPYIIRPHGSLDPYLYARSSRSLALKRLYERLVDLPNLHGASAIHYTAEDERIAASYMNLRAPGFVVPNGLDWSRYAVLPARGAMRAKLGIGNCPVVLFLGRLHHKKGLDILVAAFDAIHQENPTARLVIAGPEPDGYGVEIRKLIARRGIGDAVLFVGALQGVDVEQAYVDADVFVLPSYTENFGMTIVEAMACGTPVVISDRVNIHAEVTRAGAGIVTGCNAEEVAIAIATLLADEEKRRVYGRSGRSFVQQHFTWPAIVQTLQAEYENILRRHRESVVNSAD